MKEELEGHIVLKEQEAGHHDDQISLCSDFRREGEWLKMDDEKLLSHIIKRQLLNDWKDWEHDIVKKVSKDKIKIKIEIIEEDG